jgi:2,2-dialkylglycine decarboxylase (pyruvate)
MAPTMMSGSLGEASKQFLVRYGGDAFPNLFTKAKGTIVTDSTGRQYLDFTSGQMCATIGHNHPAIVAAVNRAGEKAFHFFSGMIPEVVAELVRTLAEDWLPGNLQKTIFINTGSEATEVALRMAKMYTGGYEVLALGGSWHSITGGAGSVSMASDRKGYGVPAPGVFVIPEPNSYRPYIPGLPAEESAMACPYRELHPEWLAAADRVICCGMVDGLKLLACLCDTRKAEMDPRKAEIELRE